MRRRPSVSPTRLRELASGFHIYGDIVSIEPYGSGHINDTFCVRVDQAGTPVRYVLQRLNTEIFRNPAAVMDNITRVTAHLAAQLQQEGAPEASRRTLTLVPARRGGVWCDEADGAWRCYLFIERARTWDEVQSPAQAAAAARAFAEFQRRLAGLPPPPLAETIPGFHDTPRRFRALQAAIAADPHNRAARAREEIAFALAHEAIVDRLERARADGRLPVRVTHNDTKLNNVMLDETTGEGICVIDLDTVMPGVVLYDFGDMCRTATRPTAEDERELARVRMRRDMYEALVRGYLEGGAAFLTAAEVELLAFSAQLITFEIGTRFLTDFLEGDVYFKTRRPEHNLDRCRVQFAMVRSFEENAEWMQRATLDAWARAQEGRP
ncbi:MAG: aminoglycoside phosphotransferase family protein [Kiritimatiellae bacterium]|nr:aminoglycoside phosphotransferase family protein [Kiritimatiellia bacterium]